MESIHFQHNALTAAEITTRRLCRLAPTVMAAAIAEMTEKRFGCVGVADGEQVVDFERSVKRFADDGDVVEFALARPRRGLGRLVRDAFRRAQGHDAIDCFMEGGDFFGAGGRPSGHGRSGECRAEQ